MPETENIHDDSRKLQKFHPSKSISLWIDCYDDIFSDFDPRPFSERNISDDFLYEIKRVSSETVLSISELRLLIPKAERDAGTESIITRRLHAFFIKNLHYFRSKKKMEKRKGFLFVLAGAVLMAGATMLSALQSEGLLMHIMLVIAEPAAWFFMWIGMENLVNTSWKEKRELDFYERMTKSKIIFTDM